MSTAGGEISKSAANLDAQLINIPFDKLQIKSGGYGILDVVFLRDSNKAWGAPAPAVTHTGPRSSPVTRSPRTLARRPCCGS